MRRKNGDAVYKNDPKITSRMDFGGFTNTTYTEVTLNDNRFPEEETRSNFCDSGYTDMHNGAGME